MQEYSDDKENPVLISSKSDQDIHAQAMARPPVWWYPLPSIHHVLVW